MAVVLKQNKKNYVDNIPVRNPDFSWTKNKKTGIITVTVPNTGVFNRIAQKFFHRPAESQIKLDAYGSVVWEAIDGERDVYAIGKIMHDRFGDKAEPLYERLCQFISTMRSNDFVGLK